MAGVALARPLYQGTGHPRHLASEYGGDASGCDLGRDVEWALSMARSTMFNLSTGGLDSSIYSAWIPFL